MNENVRIVALPIVVDVWVASPFSYHPHEKFVVTIDKERTVVGNEEIIQLAFSLAYPLE